jgi:hypothetical protein
MGDGGAKFGDVCVAGIKKIFLAKMDEGMGETSGNSKVIVDDEVDARPVRNRGNRVRHALNVIGSGILGAELEDVRSAIAELPGHLGDGSPVEVGIIDKRVELAGGEGRLHFLGDRDSFPISRRSAPT